MWRRHFSMALVLAALVGANLFLWLDHPSAPPPRPEARPPKLHPDAKPTPAAEPEPEPSLETTTAADETNPPPKAGKRLEQTSEQSLDLTLDHGVLADANFQDPAKPVPPITAPLHLSLDEQSPVHKWIGHDLDLFTRDVRSFSRGHWISDSLRLRGGVGYSVDDQTQERKFAIGLGIGLTF